MRRHKLSRIWDSEFPLATISSIRFSPANTPSVFNVHRYSVPLEDISLLIPQGHGASQKPAIFPIRRATVAHLVLEQFASSERCAPLVHVSTNVFRVNCGLPT